MPRGEEGGTLDFKWQGWLSGGKNQNPQKFLDQNLTPQKFHAQFLSNKNFRKALKWYNMKNRNVCNGVFVFVYSYTAGIHGNYHESSDCFEYPQKNPYLNQATKKILVKIFLLKKFQTQKNPSIILVTWNPENPHWEAKFTRLETFCSGMKPYWIYMKGSWSHITSVISVMERSCEAPIL